MANSTQFGTLYFKTIQLYLHHLLNYVVIFFTIINNGNTLADGRDPRRYAKKKYNELWFFNKIIYLILNDYYLQCFLL